MSEPTEPQDATDAPLPAAIAALVLLLLSTSCAWLTIHPDRIRRRMGEQQPSAGMQPPARARARRMHRVAA